MSVDDIIRDIENTIVNDGSANYIQLNESISSIQKVASAFMGILVVIILVGIPLIVALEVMYMTIPIMQETFNNVLNKDTKITNILGLAFVDAKKSIELANTVETGRSPIVIYLKIKTKAIIIAVIAILMVLGAGTSLLQVLINIANDILEGFRSIL